MPNPHRSPAPNDGASGARPSAPVVGRLAPSPTGALHLGNLFTFTIAACRATRGTLILRDEDLDGPRVKPGAAGEQIDDLHWAGIEWQAGPDLFPDDPRYQQSLRSERYNQVLQILREHDAVYPCHCSRRDIDNALSAPHGLPADAIYPGTCAHRHAADADVRPIAGTDYAWRSRAQGTWLWHDACAGPQSWTLTGAHDFIVRRRDGLFAYQLAVVVDDHDCGVNEVVRGRDLLDSTPRQIALHAALGWPPPAYAHVPLLVDESGRLSKRDQSMGRQRMQSVGWTPELMRGGFACLMGASTLEPMSLTELANALNSLDLTPDTLSVPATWWQGPDEFARTVLRDAPSFGRG